MMGRVEEIEIVIVGGGICGLATALALQRKGIKSVVLERSDTLRATGAALGIFSNGWRALHQLGIDSTLRSAAIQYKRAVNVWADKGVVKERSVRGEARCIRRSDLIEALAKPLTSGTIRYGCHIVSVNLERSSQYAVLQLHDGSLIKAKVLIGCDGANSVIGNYIGLGPTRVYSKCEVRGLTIYPNGHGYNPEIFRVRKDKNVVGRIPIDDKTVYWFINPQQNQADIETPKDQESIKQMTLNTTIGFPKDMIDMVEKSDLSSLYFNHVRYRAPWKLLHGNLRKGVITVAGDAWHAMGPFLGQGGSASLEDAIILARCLSKKIGNRDLNEGKLNFSTQKAMEALDEYLKERKWRVVSLCTQTYLQGKLLDEDTPSLSRIFCVLITAILFWDIMKHTRYDCGEL